MADNSPAAGDASDKPPQDEPQPQQAAEPAAAADAEPAADDTDAAKPSADDDAASKPPAASDAAAEPAATNDEATAATEPSADDSAAAAASNPSEEDAKQMEEELAALEQEIADAEAAAEERERVAGGLTADQLQTKIGRAEKELAQAQADAKAAEDSLVEQQPEFDRAMASKDLIERRDACKRDIDETEEKLAQQQKDNVALEEALAAVQAEYNGTTAQRKAFLREAGEALAALREQVSAKIRDTIDADEITSLDAFELIERLSDLVMARERELSNNQRLLREAEAVIALKRETADKLASDCEAAVSEKRRERAETVKRLVYGFQEERNALQADIEEVRRVNLEQSSNLQQGHVNRMGRDPHLFQPERQALSASGRRKPLKRLTAMKPEDEPTAEEKLVIDKNAEAERDLNETLSKCAAEQSQKTALARDQKSVKIQMQVEKSEAEASLHTLESKVVSEVERVRKLNLENARLADAVKHLTDLVRVTKAQVDRIRGHTAPLPIEED